MVSFEPDWNTERPELPPLYPYQMEGARWLASRRHALLADEMGVGKTPQAIHAADLCGADRVLVVCPAIARPQWIAEFERFSNAYRTFTLVDCAQAEIQDTDSGVISYDLALQPARVRGDFDLLILDESHFLKNPGSGRTAAIWGKHGLVHRAARIWALSGTPAPNHPGELWPLLFAFGATRLSYDAFVDYFCRSHQMRVAKRQFRRVITGTRVDRLPELRAILAPIMLRRRKTEVLPDLPAIHYSTAHVAPSPVDLGNESSFVQYVFPVDRRPELEEKLGRERDMVASIVDLSKNIETQLKGLEAVHSSVPTLRRFTGLQKMPEVARVVAHELLTGVYDKIVLFCIHRDVIHGLQTLLAPFHPVTLYGGMPVEKKEKHLHRFQNLDKYRVMLANIHAAGTAVNLTVAHHVSFVEMDWVPGNNAQAAMRCHRIGQQKPVHVRFFAMRESMDDAITRALKRKTEELTQIFDPEAQDIEVSEFSKIVVDP